MTDSIKVWREWRTEKRVCQYGEHDVTIYLGKIIYDTGETYIHDNGYEKNVAPIYKDRQGRLYYKRIEIDYYAGVYFIRQDEPMTTLWFRKYPRSGKYNEDILGRLIK